MEPLFFRYLQKLGANLENHFLPEALRLTAEMLMEFDVSHSIDAGYYERSGSRAAHRNGYRTRLWKTHYGKLMVRIPKLRIGTYHPDFLNASLEHALTSIIEDAYLYQTPPDTVQHLMNSLNIHANLAQITEFCERLDEMVNRFRQRKITNSYSYLWVDVVQLSGIQARAKIAAVLMGAKTNGETAFLGFETGTSAEDDEFWTKVIRNLVERGLSGVKLVISDAYRGLKATIYEELIGAEWQYSRTHFLQHVLENVPEDGQAAVVDAISTLFIQPNFRAANNNLDNIASQLSANGWTQASNVLSHYQQDVLAFTAFPDDQWSLIAGIEVMGRIKQAIIGDESPVVAIGQNFNAPGIAPVGMLEKTTVIC